MLSHLCSLQLHSSASRPIMFVANNAWLLTHKRLTQIQLSSVVFQALPFHYSSEYKMGLHFLTQLRHSKHILILGPKCFMHFSTELSETFRHWCRNVSVRWTLLHQCRNVWTVRPPLFHLTTSKVMAIVWRLRRNIIRTVLYIANGLPLQWAQLTKTVHTARLGLEFVFLFF